MEEETISAEEPILVGRLDLTQLRPAQQVCICGLLHVNSVHQINTRDPV